MSFYKQCLVYVFCITLDVNVCCRLEAFWNECPDQANDLSKVLHILFLCNANVGNLPYLRYPSWNDIIDIATVIFSMAGMIQSLSIQKSTDTYRYGYHTVLIQMIVTAAKTIIIKSSGSIISHLTFIQLSKWLEYIEWESDLNYV